MKVSIYTLVAVLAATVAANPMAEPEEFNLESALEERAAAGKPSKCDKFAKMIPGCARAEIKKCTKQAGCAKPLHYKCGCKHQGQITKCATSTVVKKCGNQKALKAQQAAAALCKCAK